MPVLYKEQRNMEIAAWVLVRGKRKADVARMYGLTRERVDQVIMAQIRRGVTPTSLEKLIQQGL